MKKLLTLACLGALAWGMNSVAAATTVHAGDGMDSYSEVTFTNASNTSETATAKAVYTLTATDDNKLDIKVTFENLDPAKFIGLVDACYFFVPGVGETPLTLADGVYTGTTAGTFTVDQNYTDCYFKRMSSGAYYGGDLLFPFSFTYTKGGAPVVDCPEHLYIFGALDGASWSPATAPEMTKEGNVFTAQVSLVDSHNFKFATVQSSDWDNVVNPNSYGAATDGTQLTADVPAAFVKGTGAFIAPSAGKWTVKADFSTMQVTVTEVIEPMDCPEHLYLVGDFESASWNPEQALEMTREGNKFTITTTFAGSHNFKALTAQGIWDVVNAQPAYGTPNDGQAVALDTPVRFVKGGGAAVTPATGTYIVTFDFDSGMLTVSEPSQSEDPVFPGLEEPENAEANLFSLDTMEPQIPFYNPGWGGEKDNYTLEFGPNMEIVVKLPEATNADWQAQFPFVTNVEMKADKTYYFYADIWSNKDMGAQIKLQQNENNDLFYFCTPYQNKAGQIYKFRSEALTGKDIANALVIFDFGYCPADTEIRIANIAIWEMKEGVEPPTPEAGKIFLIGAVNGWPEPSQANAELLADWALDETGEGSNIFTGEFEFEAAENNGFRFYKELTGWDADASIGAQQDDALVPFEFTDNIFSGSLVMGGKGSWQLPADFSGKVSMTVDLGTLAVKFEREPEVSIATIDADADSAVEYYTLQGVRVSEPQAGSIVIRRQGSEVTKILVK